MRQYRGWRLRIFYVVVGLLNLADDLIIIVTTGLWQPLICMKFLVWHYRRKL